jgi:hypothetical protein
VGNPFSPLWKEVPEARSTLWQSGRREVLELLCGALWHLELAAALGIFPNETLEALRQADRAWIDWLSREPRPVKVQRHPKELILQYSFSRRTPATPQVLQRMCLADGAYRLDGARAVLGPSKAPTRKSASNWLKHDGALRSGSADVEKAFIIVIAFRDMYAHGERPPVQNTADERRLLMFREKYLTKLNLRQLVSAGREVWIELLKAATAR